VADADEQAREELWPHYRVMHDRIGRERGWPPMTRGQYDAATSPNGALMVGSPSTVAAKIVRAMSGLGAQRFDLKYSAGTLPHETMLRSIELYGTEVAPRVREQLGRGAAA
jgi:alkanesulfonate monooxygenase SsuD/methylene tetrahydromethanopterin reductase-like flavin-dependent oxidoreductase (luciferase family)